MKRGGPLQRKTPLARGTSQLKRTPLKRKGAKAEREEEAWLTCKRAVDYRSGGWCEVGAERICKVTPHRAVHVHHVWPEDRDRGIHDPERCVHVCFDAHRWVHDHPAEAGLLGLLRPEGER